MMKKLPISLIDLTMEGDRCLRQSRTVRLIGQDAAARIGAKRVVLFGVGGVGSWAAEALVRSGVRDMTIVDPDVVATSNINRQLPATVSSVGKPKVEVMRQRLLDIAPEASVHALDMRYTASTAGDFALSDYDYVIDAIDSLADKALLIVNATQSRQSKLFSSMGAAMKMDPQRIAVAEFWKVKGCPLAAALRRRFKRTGIYPSRKFRCVYSDELVPNRGETVTDGEVMDLGKVAYNGAMCHITAIFGMTLASLVIRDALAE